MRTLSGDPKIGYKLKQTRQCQESDQFFRRQKYRCCFFMKLGTNMQWKGHYIETCNEYKESSRLRERVDKNYQIALDWFRPKLSE